ncbi:MarR family transcriptional regulator [Ligilactobacillus pobuzihii E100301 = KCTC 13174]|uniref:MarR family transcriptional regulator n=2 Tax=Ligilactobacillus pobuzihii TaxID=449659 RepID=A0A0R2L3R7_9LACO|nr:MarR family transcriptional regulator [Ligilactobacillus pobuzihii E100301 = KCTC 13174]KRN96270.1 MarR family transcriptional regulator [Ligilactobacillus pobuzihii]
MNAKQKKDDKAMSADYQQISDSLVKIYSNILRIEESELRKSQFNNLTIQEMHAINAISMYEHKTASQVAKELHLTPGTLTSTIDRLVKKGYVERIRSKDDRRVVRLGLTKKGRVEYRAHAAFHEKLVKQFLQGFNGEEVGVILQALRNLEGFMDEYS